VPAAVKPGNVCLRIVTITDECFAERLSIPPLELCTIQLCLPERVSEHVETREMSNAIEIEAAHCPRCNSTGIYSVGTVDLESASVRGGTWRMTGKVVKCSGCGRALKTMSREIEAQLCEDLVCQYCGTAQHLRFFVNKFEKQSPTEWLFEVTLYCAALGCSFKRILASLADLLKLKKIKIGFDGIEYERAPLETSVPDATKLKG
jgi:uncharacterized protein with PIN domain